ncbi:MAG: H(+)/Cl(-) exchange transporter ClcA [Acidobacteria bacterium]|nr:H(+)/Cl(-) exchange transporter ClcA [Acidobacteriota bacterium]
MVQVVGEGERKAPTTQSARRLVSGLRKRHERRRRLFPRVLLLGALVGLVASFFRAGAERAEELRTEWIGHLRPLGLVGFLELAAVCAFLAAFGVFLVRRFEPTAAGSGIPHLKAVLHRLRRLAGARLILVKFFGGISAIGAGFALGREGPTIQMGGALGRVVARWLPTSSHERQVLVAAGAGGGLAAAFNAPLAGVIFVLEEIQKNFAPGVFSATFLASVTADAVSRMLFGQTAVFRTAVIPQPPVEAVPLFALLGVVAGLLGVAFNRGLLGALSLTDRIPERWRVPAAAAFGVAVASIAWYAPGLVGGGGQMVHHALAGEGWITLLLMTLSVRFVLTLGSYATGSPGGIFAPLLVLGAQTGLIAGLGTAALAPSIAGEPRAWAVAGMAGLFAATVRAPLTGIVLMLEMTDSYSLMLPLLAASFAGQWTADLLGEPPVYDSLLERELAASSEIERPEGALLLELDVLPDAPFAGRRVSELGLPRGVLIVALERRDTNHVVTGTTRLAAGDRLTVIVSPEVADSVGSLRVGLGMEESG